MTVTTNGTQNECHETRFDVFCHGFDFADRLGFAFFDHGGLEKPHVRLLSGLGNNS